MNGSYRAFEAVIPPSHNNPDEAVAVLRSCATAQGIELHEQPPEAYISPTQLEELSFKRWGTAVYGHLATDMLQDLQVRSTGRVHIDRQSGTVSVSLPHYGLTYETGRIGSRDMGDRQINNATNALLSTVVSPFPFLVKNHDQYCRYIEPLAPTQPRLARYLGARGLWGHNLHGMVGKGLDVWSLAAGVEPATQPPTREWRGPYMSDATLREKMLNAGFSSGQVHLLHTKIRTLLSEQWYRGAARPPGEIIVDYDPADPAPDKPGDWQRIAHASFPPLAESYDRETPVIAFLEELFAGVKSSKNPRTLARPGANKNKTKDSNPG